MEKISDALGWKYFFSLQRMLATIPGMLVAANVGVAAAQLVSPAVDRWLWVHATLIPGGRFRKRPYTLLTHAFHHVSPLHCALNCAALWSFGEAAARYLRPARLLGLYTAASLAGGAAHLAHASVTRYSPQACMGASGAVLGLATFVQLLNPHGQTLVLFVIPMPNWSTVLLMGGVSAYYLQHPEADSTGLAHAGHLGGMAAGALAALLARRGLLRG